MSFAFFSHADAPDRLSWRLVWGIVVLAGIVYIAWRPPKRQVAEPQTTTKPASRTVAGVATEVLFITCTEDFILLTPSLVAAGEPVEVAAIAEWQRLVRLHGNDGAGKAKRSRLRDAAETRMQAALASAKSWLLTNAAATKPVVCVLGNDAAAQLTAWLRAACRDIPVLYETGSRIVCVAV